MTRFTRSSNRSVRRSTTEIRNAFRSDDGAIYIADWYNPIIQHGEVDFRDPRRDYTHGRIWRVTAKNRPLVPRRVFAWRDETLTLIAGLRYRPVVDCRLFGGWPR